MLKYRDPGYKVYGSTIINRGYWVIRNLFHRKDGEANHGKVRLTSCLKYLTPPSRMVLALFVDKVSLLPPCIIQPFRSFTFQFHSNWFAVAYLQCFLTCCPHVSWVIQPVGASSSRIVRASFANEVCATVPAVSVLCLYDTECRTKRLYWHSGVWVRVKASLMKMRVAGPALYS